MRRISVVIADHTKTTRAGYVKQLRPEKGIQVVAEAESEQAVVAALRLKPRILVLDWRMISRSEVLLPWVRRNAPRTRVILLINRVGRRRLIHALAYGARGYLGRTLAGSSLAKAVCLVDKGDVWVSRAMVPALIAVLSRRAFLKSLPKP